jgi:anti-sigma regulatory factor (Ser/Thr protein kinase)
VSQSRDLTHTEFTLNGDLEELAHLLQEVERFCAAQGIAGDPEFQLTLVLDELFTNSIRHGGCQGIAGAVVIRLEPAGNAIRVEFRDRGTPFDPLSAPPPDLTADLAVRAKGGLGVHFVRQIMRHLQYDRCGDWNRLTMELPI